MAAEKALESAQSDKRELHSEDETDEDDEDDYVDDLPLE